MARETLGRLLGGVKLGFSVGDKLRTILLEG